MPKFRTPGTVWTFLLATFLFLFLAGCGSSLNDFVFTGTTNATLVGLKLTPETASLAPGTARQLTAEALYSNGTSQVVNAEADWASSNPAAVTVSDSGLVSAVAPDAATIEATFGGFSDTATITVTDVTLTGLSVTPETPNIVLGNTLQLTASATFSDSTISNVTGQSTWTSSDEAIATVDQNGLISPVAVGPVTITATFGGQSDSALVTVSAAPLDPPVATSLSFFTQPGNSLAAEIVFPTVTVEVLDQYGARLDTDATITLFFGSNPTGASLAGRSVAAVNGLATFSALSVDRPGTGYTLVATGAGLDPVSSDPFNVNLSTSVFRLFSESLAIPAQANPDQGGNSSTRWSDTADFNNDGRLDAVTLVGSANQVRVHLRQDDGRFSPLDLTVTDASALAAGDLDGDGNADLLVVRRGANRKTVYLGNGDGTFNTPTDSVAPAGVNDIRLVEATGDSLPDLVIAAENLDRMYLFENNGTSTVFNDVRDAEFTLTGDGEAIAAGNLDGANDGLDVVVGLATGANDIVILYDYDATTNTFGSNTAIPAQGTVRALALGNVDSTIGLDIVVGSSSGIDSLLNDGNANPTFTSSFKANNLFPAPNMAIPAHPRALAVGHLGGSGDHVVIADSFGTNQNVRVFSDILSADPPLVLNVPHGPLSVVLGDFNGDTTSDISVLNRSSSGSTYLSSTSTLAILLNGPRVLGPTRLGNDNNSETETRVNANPAVGDVNGDGFTDLVVASSGGNPSVDEIQIWLGDGDEYRITPDIVVSTIVGNAADEFETNPLSVALLDLEGDGDLDLVLADSVLGENGGRFFLNGGGLNPTFTVDDANSLNISEPKQVLTAQLDGDAELELVWRSDTTITVANGSYPYEPSEVLTIDGGGANDLAAGFLNGDAFADLVGSTGTGIVVFYNDGAGDFLPAVQRLGPGAPPNNINRVASGDLDGDGLWDVAASQSNSNQIHLFFSLGDSFEDLSITTVGSEGPQGMAIGDLNADGLNDLVVAGRTGSNVGVYLGQGSRFLRSFGALLSGIVSHVTLADLDDNGRVDIVSGSSTGAGGLFPLVQ